MHIRGVASFHLFTFRTVQSKHSGKTCVEVHGNDTEELSVVRPFYVKMMFLVGGGLGNLMFQYATVYATARRYHMQPVMWEGEDLLKYFKLSAVLSPEEKVGANWTVYGLPFPEDERAEDTRMGGYNQRYIDFKDFADEIRNEFTFLDEIREVARENFQKILEENKLKSVGHTIKGSVRVGVHIRRGDFLQPHNIRHGFTVASVSYLNKAMDYFRKKYRNVVFIIISDNIEWALGNLHGGDMFFFHGDRSNDLYLMSTCDHVIATVGTFSWWSGFLAGGEVVYYKNFPRKDSTYGKYFHPEEYYPKHWVPMGD